MTSAVGRDACAFLLVALAASGCGSSDGDAAPSAGSGGTGGTGGAQGLSGGSSGTGTSGSSFSGSDGGGGKAGSAAGGSGGSANAGRAGSGGADGNSGAAGSAGTFDGAGGSAAGSAGSDAGGVGQGGSAAGGTGGDPLPSGEPTEAALEPLREVRQEHAVVALAGEIYVIGGYVAGQVSDSIDAYDPESDSWREATSFPAPLQHPNAGVVGDRLYVAGWYETPGTTSTSEQCFEYDPVADAWTEKRPMPAGTGRATGCVAVHDGLFYIFGGAIDGTSVTDSSRYDPAADEWEVLPELPAPREHCAAGAIDGILYVAGGRVDEIVNIEADVWAFDPVAKTWTPKQSLLKPRAGLAAAVLGDKLYTFGGEGNPDSTSGIFDDIEVYDPGEDAWEALPPMLVPRHGFGAGIIGARIYLAGGAIRQGGTPSDENSVFYLE